MQFTKMMLCRYHSGYLPGRCVTSMGPIRSSQGPAAVKSIYLLKFQPETAKHATLQA